MNSFETTLFLIVAAISPYAIEAGWRWTRRNVVTRLVQSAPAWRTMSFLQPGKSH